MTRMDLHCSLTGLIRKKILNGFEDLMDGLVKQKEDFLRVGEGDEEKSSFRFTVGVNSLFSIFTLKKSEWAKLGTYLGVKLLR